MHLLLIIQMPRVWRIDYQSPVGSVMAQNKCWKAEVDRQQQQNRGENKAGLMSH